MDWQNSNRPSPSLFSCFDFQRGSPLVTQMWHPKKRTNCRHRRKEVVTRGGYTREEHALGNKALGYAWEEPTVRYETIVAGLVQSRGTRCSVCVGGGWGPPNLGDKLCGVHSFSPKLPLGARGQAVRRENQNFPDAPDILDIWDVLDVRDSLDDLDALIFGDKLCRSQNPSLSPAQKS